MRGGTGGGRETRGMGKRSKDRERTGRKKGYVGVGEGEGGGWEGGKRRWRGEVGIC